MMDAMDVIEEVQKERDEGTRKIVIQAKQNCTAPSGKRILYVSADMHRRVKSVAADSGITMEEFTESALEEALNGV